MLEDLVSQESLLTPPSHFTDSLHSNANGKDDPNDAFMDEVSQLFQLMGAEDEDPMHTSFDIDAESTMILDAEGMTPLPLLLPSSASHQQSNLASQSVPTVESTPTMDLQPSITSTATAAAATALIHVLPPLELQHPHRAYLHVACSPQESPYTWHPHTSSAVAEEAAASAASASSSEKGISNGAARNVVERKEWTKPEDDLIRMSVQTHGCKWRLIAALLPGRSDDAVRNRWKRLSEAAQPKPSLVRADASSGDLIEARMGGSKPEPRKPNSESEPERVSWSRQERVRVSWSRQEDEMIMQSVSELGTKWGRIARRLPNRTEHAIRNRYSRLQSLIEHGQSATLFMPIAAC